MKKSYQSPAATNVFVELHNMIAASDLIKDNQQDLTEAPTTDKTSGNLSRRGVWEDEELDEEQ